MYPFMEGIPSYILLDEKGMLQNFIDPLIKTYESFIAPLIGISLTFKQHRKINEDIPI